MDNDYRKKSEDKVREVSSYYIKKEGIEKIFAKLSIDERRVLWAWVFEKQADAIEDFKQELHKEYD